MSSGATPSSPAGPPRSSASPTKSPGSGRVTRSSAKKESFKWNTPADEFADDVASDAEEEVDFEEEKEKGQKRKGSLQKTTPVEAEIDGERFQAHRTEDGEIIIHLGVEEAERFSVQNSSVKIVKKEGGDEILSSSLDDYKVKDSAEDGVKKKAKSKTKFQCPKCDKVWNWPWELRRHVLTHYKEKERAETATYKCEECGRGFQWKRDLAQHKRLHTGEKLLVCSVCEKKFTTRQALLHHVVVHTGEKPFQCAMCGNRFTQPANLRTHMKKKHDSSHGIRNNKCPHCQETFQSIIAVHQHILEDHPDVVAEEREAQTLEKMKKEQEKADRERRREENRRKRIERRKEKMDYHDFRAKGLQEWEINYEFHIAEGLVKGVDWDRTPSNGELQCEICDRKFGWRYEMMFHNLCHKTDEHGNTKNRVCPECDTAFKVPIGLKHHLLLHTGELPFLCLHCWRSFSSHIDLKLHIRKEHLSHLEPPPPPPKAKTPRTPREPSTVTPKRTPKRQKTEVPAANAVTIQQQQLTEQQLVAAVQAATGGELGENVQVVVASEQGEGDNQTILVNSDGTIVQTGDQDMIVVIQSDDGSVEQVQQQGASAAAQQQQQQLIVVDPGQLQQMVGSDGTAVTLVEAGGGASGETVVLGEGEAARILQLAGGGNLPEGAQVVLAQPGSSGEGVKYVMASPGSSQQHASEFQHSGTTTTTTTLVMESSPPPQQQNEGSGATNGVQMIVSDGAGASEEPSTILPEQDAPVNGDVGAGEEEDQEATAIDTKEGILDKKAQLAVQQEEQATS